MGKEDLAMQKANTFTKIGMVFLFCGLLAAVGCGSNNTANSANGRAELVANHHDVLDLGDGFKGTTDVNATIPFTMTWEPKLAYFDVFGKGPGKATQIYEQTGTNSCKFTATYDLVYIIAGHFLPLKTDQGDPCTLQITFTVQWKLTGVAGICMGMNATNVTAEGKGGSFGPYRFLITKDGYRKVFPDLPPGTGDPDVELQNIYLPAGSGCGK
jgi:hypothetical protein